MTCEFASVRLLADGDTSIPSAVAAVDARPGSGEHRGLRIMIVGPYSAL